MFVSELKIVVFELNNFFVDFGAPWGRRRKGEKDKLKVANTSLAVAGRGASPKIIARAV